MDFIRAIAGQCFQSDCGLDCLPPLDAETDSKTERPDDFYLSMPEPEELGEGFASPHSSEEECHSPGCYYSESFRLSTIKEESARR
ncbi:unnamed protein product, partial [Heterosigma akashiwo]